MKKNGQHVFREAVYKIARHIPKGTVATYGQLATLAGHPHGGRAVGYFMKTNPDAPRIPCHRVVGSDGSLVGFSGVGGIAKKKAMLLSEGVIFNNKKVDLSCSGWK